jgi:HK97 family phage major capsid protein
MADDVLEEIQREIKSFGDDVKGLRESMNKDLEAVRKLAEEAKTAAERPEVKSQIEALTKSVAEKDAAIQKKVEEILDKALKGATSRLDDFEKRLNRGRLGGGSGDSDAAFKSARDFMRTAATVRGELKVGNDLPDEKIDVEAYKSYCGVFPLYLRRDEKSLQGADVKAMAVGSDPDGGYFVTPQVGNIITGVVFETSPMRQIATVETISTDAIEYPRDDDEASAGWVGEQESRTDTNTPKAGLQRIPVHELYASPKATQKLLEDSAFDIEGWLGRKVGDKFGRLEATAFVTGNGVKRPRGFTTYASGTYAAGTAGKIEQVAAGTAATVGFDDLINLLTALKEYYLGGAVWLMQRATVGKVMLLKDGDGHYLWQPNTQAGKPSVLLGYEVRQAADLDAVAGSKLPIAFGNFKMGYTIVDRLGISTLRDPYTAKPFVVYYTRKRVGGDVTNFEAIKLLAT